MNRDDFKPPRMTPEPCPTTPYLELAQALDKAKEFLNQGNAGAALNVLEYFAAGDMRGIHTAYPEYYEILMVCQRSLGRDTRNTANQISELRMDWIAALSEGQRLLKAGKAKESIAYFTRSLAANPGEAGTATDKEAARQGLKSAEAALKRRENS